VPTPASTAASTSPCTTAKRVGGKPGGLGTTIVLVGVLGALATFWGAYHLFKGAITITKNAFPGPLEDGDLISMAEGPGSPGALTWSLTNSYGRALWTAVEVYDSTDALRGSAWVIERDARSEASVIAADLTGWYMVFKKAKLFGVHTSMYVIRDITGWTGSRVDFNWTDVNPEGRSRR